MSYISWDMGNCEVGKTKAEKVWEDRRGTFLGKGFDFLFLPQLHGVLRVILEPLIGDLPIVGAVSMFFIRRPVRENNEGVWGSRESREDWEDDGSQRCGMRMELTRRPTGLATVGWV